MPNAHLLEQFAKEFPPIIARTEVGRLTGGLISPRTMANLDSKRLGPRKIKFGKKVAYSRDSFILFLSKRLKVE